MRSIAVQSVANFLLAPLLVLSAALLVKGHAGSGDGFAAGAIAGAALSLQYVAHGVRAVREAFPVRAATGVAAAGLGLALAVAAQSLARGEPLLTHAPAPGAEPLKLGTLELITGLAFEAGVFALVFGSVVAIVDALAAALEDGDEER